MLVPKASSESSIFLPYQPLSVCLAGWLMCLLSQRPAAPPFPASGEAEMMTPNENLQPADAERTGHRGETAEDAARTHVIRRVI